MGAINRELEKHGSPQGEVCQICTETRQLWNDLTAHSPSGCLGSSMPRC